MNCTRIRAVTLALSVVLLRDIHGGEASGTATAQRKPVQSVEVKLGKTGVFPTQIEVHPGTIALFIRDMTGLPTPTFIADVDVVKQLLNAHFGTIQGSPAKPSVGMFLTLTPGVYFVWEATNPAVFIKIVVAAN